LVRYPQEVVPIFDLVVYEEYQNIIRRITGENVVDDLPGNTRIQVRTFKLLDGSRMRDLNPENVDQLVSIKGMIIRTSNIIPDLKMAYFSCSVCGHGMEVMMDRGRIDHPNNCENCGTGNQMEMIHNRSVFANRQLVKMQESPEMVSEGETPHTITLHAFDDLVDVAKPGDRVEITGIYRAHPIRVNPRTRTLNSVYKVKIKQKFRHFSMLFLMEPTPPRQASGIPIAHLTLPCTTTKFFIPQVYIDVLHVRKTDAERLSIESASSGIDSEDYTSFEENNDTQRIMQEHREKMEEIGRSPDIYEKLGMRREF
jgi:DNA replicative helicase MCM subunit Mcm2 (Cdc46/Mcm family)